MTSRRATGSVLHRRMMRTVFPTPFLAVSVGAPLLPVAVAFFFSRAVGLLRLSLYRAFPLGDEVVLLGRRNDGGPPSVSVLEAASVRGAGSIRPFFAITFPLLSPVTFFLFTLNMTFSFFDTFGLVHAVTQGGPGDATSILVFRAWKDGFDGLQLGYSAAQSVILMLLVIALTAVQFRFAEKKVTY